MKRTACGLLVLLTSAPLLIEAGRAGACLIDNKKQALQAWPAGEGVPRNARFQVRVPSQRLAAVLPPADPLRLARLGSGLLLASLLLLTGCLPLAWLLPGPAIPPALAGPAGSAAPPAAEDRASIARLARRQRAALAGAIILDVTAAGAMGAGVFGAIELTRDRPACGTFCQIGISSLMGVGIAVPLVLALALHRIEADLRQHVAAGAGGGLKPAAAPRP